MMLFYLTKRPSASFHILSLHDALPIYPFFHLKMEDVWVWDKNRPTRIIPRAEAWTSSEDRKSTRLNQSRFDLVCRLLLEKKKMRYNIWASGYDVDRTDQTSLGQFSDRY